MMKTPAESTLNHISEQMYPIRDYRKYLESFISSSEYVVFYGCGMIFPSIFQTWNDCISRKIDFLCDSNPEKWGTSISGIRCLSCDELLAIKDRCVVFVTIGDFWPVWTYLQKNGFPKVSLLHKYDLQWHAMEQKPDLQFILNSLAGTYEFLADNESRMLFDAMIQRFFRGNDAPEWMSRFYTPDQYFPSGLIHLSDRECIVDVGAFDGDTLRDFVSRTGNHFERYDAFELCRENYLALNETAVAISGCERIRTFNCGLGDCREDITYQTALSESRVGGEESGKLDKLDHILHPEDKVTFIKMDIEGYELKALQGAERVIRNWKPTLAICIYHDLCHWWEIPSYIKSLYSDYRIYFRHHTHLSYETVCYALPPTGEDAL